jgi:hypothetical protein
MAHSLPRFFTVSKSILLASMAVATGQAATAAVVGQAGIGFYTPMTTVNSGANGDLVSYRDATVALGTDSPALKAWNVMYRSKDAKGAANLVTGTVLVPTTAWAGTGDRPIISYAVGTHGLNQRCAPSLQMQQGTDYENANILAALKQGYAVVVSDYAGYTTGNSPTYLAGQSQGHAVLDIITAAKQIPSVGLAATAQSAVWGYSQGGQSAAWAAEMQKTYAPNLNMVGVAAGGVPGAFLTTARYLDGNNGSSFMLQGIVGLAEQYPTEIPLNTLASAAGQTAIATAKNQCVFESLFEFMNKNLSTYTAGNKTLDQLLAQNPQIKAVLDSQNLGNTKPSVPMYQYHGAADEFIPVEQSYDLKKAYCSKFGSVTYDLFPSEHIVTQFQGATTALSWLGDRFTGKAINNSCSSLKAAPTSTSNPVNGDFIVSLKNWKLDAVMSLAKLKQDVILPAESTLLVDTNISRNLMSGNMSVPDFKQTLKVVGLPATTAISVRPTSAITGMVSLDGKGQLKIRGTAYADIVVTSVAGIPVGECKTVEPVAFPLNFDGPVSALGSGNLTFTGTTSFPKLKGCIISAVMTSLMSGDGQIFKFTATAPAPVRY